MRYDVLRCFRVYDMRCPVPTRFPSLLLSILLAGVLALSGCSSAEKSAPSAGSSVVAEVTVEDASFTQEEIDYAFDHLGYESYSELDSLGRCGVAMACLGPETIPDYGEERESISEIHPTGWRSIRYDFVEGESLYNRSHLIGWALSAENANERNLVTGTRWMNADAMRPYEEQVADYIYDTDYHVLYRSTPVFEGDELVCRGVRVEAYSLEDSGRGINFNIWCPNVQPGVEIDYETGEAWLAEDEEPVGEQQSTDAQVERDFVLNTSSHKVHDPDCPGVSDIAPSNRESFEGTLAEAESMGYEPCGQCLAA